MRKRYYLGKKDFLKALDDFRPDIVNPHYVVSYGWLATYCDQCPVVATAWGSDLLILPQKSIVHRLRIDAALKHARYCTVDHKNLYEAVARFTEQEKIIEVIMGVDREIFQSVQKSKFDSSEKLRVIAPRGLQKVYDPETIIAGAIMIKGKLDLQIDLLGRDTDRIEGLIKRASLTEIIKLCSFLPHAGFVESLKDYEIYLSASHSDSTSVALLEAMSAGLYPVVSDIPGNRNWITDGENGQLFECGSPESLAEALEKAVARRQDFADIAVENRNRVEEKAIWQDNMERLYNIFKRLVD